MIKRILFFYIDGFKNMSSIAQKLWVIIIIKLVVIFVVLRVFFLPTLSTKVESKEAQKTLYINKLTNFTTNQQKKEE